MAKKPTRRSKEKYPALIPHLNLRTRFEQIDYDYIDQLTDAEKDWLNRFTEEYTNASFKNKKDRIHNPNKKITTIDKNGKEVKTTYEKDSYNRNNQRNADILTRAKASGKIYGLEVIRFAAEQLSPEELIIQRETLKEILESEETIKRAETDKNFKKIIEEFKEKLEDLDQLFHEMKSSYNSGD